jgi:transforming growth factor-beta-induced protein
VVDGGVVLNGTVNVIITDIVASNGVIHVIDAVLLPPAEELQTIAEIAVEDGRFETLVAALTAAGLVGTFADASEGPFTVFAPTDLAFDALPAGTLEALLGDIPALTNILLYHVLDGDVRAADVIAAAPFEAETLLEDATISVEVVDGGVVLNGTVNVIITDIVASNGVIHVIDAVLLPPTP